jgi:hypothetical protein
LSKTKSAKDYENLGRMVATIYDSGYLNRVQSLKFSFLKGLMSGLGGIVGATAGIALLAWLLGLFDTVPLVGRFIESLRDTLEH